VDEDVATTDLVEECALGAVVEEVIHKLELSLQLLVSLWRRRLIADVEPVATDTLIQTQKHKNNLFGRVVLFDHALHVGIAGGSDSSVRYIGPKGLTKQVGLALGWLFGFGHVNDQAASALLLVLLPGESSGYGPVDSDELGVALSALPATGEVFWFEFGFL